MNKVACCGTFDYEIHEGHIAFLNFAKSFGDYLCVFIVSDLVVLRNKGRIPIYDQRQRCKNVLSLSLVNEVIADYDEIIKTSVDEIIKFRPSIYVFGRDQFTKFDVLLECTLKLNKIQIERSTLPLTISTTEILKQKELLCE